MSTIATEFSHAFPVRQNASGPFAALKDALAACAKALADEARSLAGRALIVWVLMLTASLLVFGWTGAGIFMAASVLVVHFVGDEFAGDAT